MALTIIAALHPLEVAFARHSEFQIRAWTSDCLFTKWKPYLLTYNLISQIGKGFFLRANASYNGLEAHQKPCGARLTVKNYANLHIVSMNRVGRSESVDHIDKRHSESGEVAKRQKCSYWTFGGFRTALVEGLVGLYSKAQKFYRKNWIILYGGWHGWSSYPCWPGGQQCMLHAINPIAAGGRANVQQNHHSSFPAPFQTFLQQSSSILLYK